MIAIPMPDETKRHKPNNLLWLVIALVLIAIVGGVLVTRRGGAPEEAIESSIAAGPLAPKVALSKPAEDLPFKISGIRHDARGIDFTIKLTAEQAIASFEEPLIFCVPDDREITPVLRAFRLGERLVFDEDASDITSDDDSISTTTQASSNDASPKRPALQKFDPAKTLRIKDLGVMRRWRLVTLELRPAFFAPARESPPEERAPVTAEISLTWDEPFESPAEPIFAGETDESWGWGRVGSSFVLNPSGLARYQMSAPPLRDGVEVEPKAPWHAHPEAEHWARLRIEERGLYQLNLDDLISVGFPASEVSASAVRVFSRGESISLLRTESGAGAGVYFWADKIATTYSGERVYWVTLGEDLPDPAIAPIDADEVVGVPREGSTTTRTAVVNMDSTLKLEHDNFFAIAGIEWVDRQFSLDESIEFEADLHHYAPPSVPLETKIRFYFEDSIGPSRASRFEITLTANGEPAATFDISGATRSQRIVERTVSLAPDLVRAGANQFAMSIRKLPAQRTGGAVRREIVTDDKTTPVWFDNFDVNYPSRARLVEGKLTLHDTTSLRSSTVWTPIEPDHADAMRDAIAIAFDQNNQPVGSLRLDSSPDGDGYRWPGGVGRRVEVRAMNSIALTPRFETVHQSALADEDQGADWLAISHRGFIDLLEPLAEMHRRSGMRAKIIDVQDIYDTFGHGELDPESIRDFLAYTLAHWKQGAPSYVLLVGDANSDYLNVIREDIPNLVPSYTYNFRGDRWASDHWMSVVAGQDDLAEFMLGRFSVADRTDAAAVIDKTIAYATSSEFGQWRSRLGYIADNGEFPPVVEQVRLDHTPGAYESVRIYLDGEMPLEDNWYLEQGYVEEKRLKVSPVATAEIIRAFRSGMSVLTFWGHGAPNIWTDEHSWFGGGSENSDNLHLIDSGYMSFVTNMTCNTGAIDYPKRKWNIAISEDMMRVRNGGAIGLLVPSGPSVTQIHLKMSAQIRHALFKDNVRRFGEFSALSRARYTARGHPEQLTYMYILLGDPAVELQLTSDARTFEPPEPSLMPAQRLRFSLTGIEPVHGRYLASLETLAGDPLWESRSAAYESGSVMIDLVVPSDAPLGDARLRVYAWNESQREDLAASANLKIERPRARLTSVVATRKESGAPLIEIEIENTTSLSDVQGVVDVLRLAADGSASHVGQQGFVLGPGELRALKVEIADDEQALDIASPTATAFEVWITHEDDGTTSTTRRRWDSRRVALAPPEQGAVVLSAALSRWEKVENKRIVKLEAVALGRGDESIRWTVGIEDASGDMITEQAMGLEGGAGETIFMLRTKDSDRAASGTMWLKRKDAADGQGEIVSRLAVADIPRYMPHLRIRPGTIQVEPESPSDGHTIFVHFEVENTGSAATLNFTAGLYGDRPDQGGKPLYAEFGSGRLREDPLEPGETRRLTLRWDPVANAGDQSFFVALDAGRPKGAASMDDYLRSHGVHVRSKADLRVGGTMIEAIEVDGQRSFRLKGEVINNGETEARNIVVTFYRSRTAIEENKIAEGLLATLPPHSQMTVQAPWTPDLETETMPDIDRMEPYHQLRLKGSQQRMRRLEDESSPAED